MESLKDESVRAVTLVTARLIIGISEFDCKAEFLTIMARYT